MPGVDNHCGTVPSTADRSAMRSSACSMLWHAPAHVEVGPQAGQCGDVAGAATLTPVRVGPVMGLMPNHVGIVALDDRQHRRGDQCGNCRRRNGGHRPVPGGRVVPAARRT